MNVPPPSAVPSHLVLIRHAAVQVTPSLPTAAWPLTAAGALAAQRLADHPALSVVTLVAHSPELKARATAGALAGSRRLVEVPDLTELDRTAAGFLSAADY